MRQALYDLFVVLAITCVIAWLVAIFGPSLDVAPNAAQIELTHDLAAAQYCRTQHGESSYTWDSHERLVCIPRHGKQVVEAALSWDGPK